MAPLRSVTAGIPIPETTSNGGRPAAMRTSPRNPLAPRRAPLASWIWSGHPWTSSWSPERLSQCVSGRHRTRSPMAWRKQTDLQTPVRDTHTYVYIHKCCTYIHIYTCIWWAPNISMRQLFVKHASHLVELWSCTTLNFNDGDASKHHVSSESA